MSLPDIDFRSIRPFNGSQRDGFEELCCQLARLEPGFVGLEFQRKGQGGDAGVECFVRFSSGEETGWQAKYVFRWDDNFSKQLDESIRTALEKHPALVEYIVCIPFDLPDSRSGKGKTTRQKWEDWRSKWKRRAKEDQRQLSIALWGKSELIARLTKGGPTDAGRTLYWFDAEAMTTGWFRIQFDAAKASLGNRYTPETNVELPLRQDFIAFARHPQLQKEIDDWFLEISDKGRSAVNAVSALPGDGANAQADAVTATVDALASLLGAPPVALDSKYPLDDWISAVSDSLSAARETLDWSFSLPRSKPGRSGIEPERWARHAVYRLVEALHDIEDALSSNRWRMANAEAVLFVGPAGIGKSHFLADFVNHHLQQSVPALLFLGGPLRDGELWPQIRDRLDRPPTEQFRHFLGALDAAAEAAGTRAILCIDALNEGDGVNIWPERLPAFLEIFTSFPRVSVVLSCRDTYLRHIVPDHLTSEKLLRVEHRGFGGNSDAAADKYLNMRGIARPSVPDTVPEFQYPLFLKTCCDALDKRNTKEFPRGIRGITAIFDFYNEAVAEAVESRMKLDPHQGIVSKAISEFTAVIAAEGTGYVEKSKVIALFETILPSTGSREGSLLSQFENEGLLTVEITPDEDEVSREKVRFTFERYGDHAIAARLLDNHLDEERPLDSFQAGQPMHEFVFGPKEYECASVIEALAIQLPERVGVEILDFGTGHSCVTRDAFVESLLWRDQSCFTERTFALARDWMHEDEFTDLLISIGTEPSNEFNAFFLHRELTGMAMPERDASWSVHLAIRGFEGPTKVLASWALRSGFEYIEEDRAHLAAVMLAWFFTTSHREVRDKATKALACLLSGRLRLAVRLLERFDEVDDLYVSERLLAACYGAVLQGRGDDDSLALLAGTVFNRVVADGEPPSNALLRDHALGILEYTAHRDLLPPSVDLSVARPPYRSPWPIEHVPDAVIEGYKEGPEGARVPDSIVMSTFPHGGDFARYVVAYKTGNWSPASIGTKSPPTAHDLLEAWLDEFWVDSNAEQQTALLTYWKAALAVESIDRSRRTSEDGQLANAERLLRSTMTGEQWEDFRVQAMDAIRHLPLASTFREPPAVFNLEWALRWICKKAHELGWALQRFEDFERWHITHDRSDHRIERIGKKYQWIALQELIARMADNLAFLGDGWDGDTDVTHVFKGAYQIGLRNIDPSLLVTGTHYDGWAEWPRTWWVPFEPLLRPVSSHERLAWLRSDKDIINSPALIEVSHSETGEKWLALEGFSKWTGRGVSDRYKETQRDTWFRLRCMVVDRSCMDRVLGSLKQKILLDDHELPVDYLLHDFHLGEYPWHPGIGDSAEQSSFRGWQPPVPVKATVATYSCEQGGYDYSIDRTIRFEMPAKWLADVLGLRMGSGKSPVFADGTGATKFFDPSLFEPGPSAALVDREAFLQALEQEQLAAIWVVAGEKSIYGGQHAGMGFGGSIRHTAAYYLQDGELVRCFHKEEQRPSMEQLQEFFGSSEIPKGIAPWAVS